MQYSDQNRLNFRQIFDIMSNLFNKLREKPTHGFFIMDYLVTSFGLNKNKSNDIKENRHQ